MSIIEKVLDRMEKGPNKAQPSALRNTQDDDKKGYLERHDSKNNKANASSVRARAAEVNKSSRIVNINYKYLKKFGILVPQSHNVMLSEQYRRIKRHILLNAFDEKHKKSVNPNLVLVTSAAPEEGKSFTSLNLAFSVTNEFNNTVLFVDADLPKHTSTNRLGLANEEGLTDYLLDDTKDIADILLRTDIPNLSVITAGKNPDWTPELLGSKRMSHLLAELSQRYNDRLVIIDAPPLLQDSSACVLAEIVGQVVVVIEAEKTPQHVVQEALDTIKDAHYIGLILNKSNQRHISEYGYYGYANY